MKLSQLTVFIFIASITVCRGQAITISGLVGNGAGSGIEGVLVRLGKANISATTGPDGRFTLQGTANSALHPAGLPSLNGNRPFVIRNDRLYLMATEPADVSVAIYDGTGKLMFSHRRGAPANDPAIVLPHLTNGTHLYRVSIDHTGYTFKSVSGMATAIRPASSRISAITARQRSTAARIDDALLCTKPGYQLFRLPVTSTDTSGILIIMASFDTGTVTDADGNTYKTMRYGNQIWTVENLRSTKYNNGESIPLIADSAAWSELETPACCFYGYAANPAERRKWGAFYNWHAVNTGKLAPAGWHVSTDADWDTLLNYLIAGGYNFDGTINENKIAKSIAATTDWLASVDSGATGKESIRNNASGFTGIPNGYCDYAGETYYRSWYAFWWTATGQDSTFVKIRGISYSSGDLKSTTFTKVYGLSVRLVRDR